MLDWDYQLDLIREHSQDATGAVNAQKISILSLENGDILTKKEQNFTFDISENEAKKIIDIFREKNFEKFKTDGIDIENRNYKFINSSENKIVFAKKQYHGTITMQSTATLVIIAFTPDGYHQANTNLAVRYLCEYFEKEEL